MRKYWSGAAVAASILALALAGCAGSSKKSSSSTSSASLTSASTSGPTSTSAKTGSNPLTKAAYESKLGPLLNGRVAPALKSALANGGAKNPQKLQTAANLIDEAHNAMASLTPPAKIAALNREAVATLGALATGMRKMRDELLAHSKSGYLSAAKATATEALKLEAVGNQFTARGY